ncbi:MAG: RNA polymerase sigma factor [Lachnospiraceae bacterium]
MGRILAARAAALVLRGWEFLVEAGHPQPAQKAGEKADASSARKARAENILDRYGNSILRYAYTFLHSREDAEEVLQETMIRYLKASPKFDSDDHEKAWLLKTAGNLAKNRIDYNRLRETDELSEELVAKEKPDLSFVWEAVRALPERYRAAVHLYYEEGYATREIAKILGEKEATVRSDLLRARRQLQKILKEEYDYG